MYISGCGSTGLDATPTVPIHTGRPVLWVSLMVKAGTYNEISTW